MLYALTKFSEKFNVIRFKKVKFRENLRQYALTKLTFEKIERYTL
jgi:hypothetical protein